MAHPTLICPEYGHDAQPGPPTTTTPTPTPTPWRHAHDGTPLCPTTAVLPAGEVTVIPATGHYSPTHTLNAAAALHTADYLTHATTAPADQHALPDHQTMNRLLHQLHQATHRLADAVAGTATRQRRLAHHEPEPLAVSGLLLADRLTTASAHLATAARTLHHPTTDHHQLHHPHQPGTETPTNSTNQPDTTTDRPTAAP